MTSPERDIGENRSRAGFLAAALTLPLAFAPPARPRSRLEPKAVRRAPSRRSCRSTRLRSTSSSPSTVTCSSSQEISAAGSSLPDSGALINGRNSTRSSAISTREVPSTPNRRTSRSVVSWAMGCRAAPRAWTHTSRRNWIGTVRSERPRAARTLVPRTAGQRDTEMPAIVVRAGLPPDLHAAGEEVMVDGVEERGLDRAAFWPSRFGEVVGVGSGDYLGDRGQHEAAIDVVPNALVVGPRCHAPPPSVRVPDQTLVLAGEQHTDPDPRGIRVGVLDVQQFLRLNCLQL